MTRGEGHVHTEELKGLSPQTETHHVTLLTSVQNMAVVMGPFSKEDQVHSPVADRGPFLTA